MYDPFTAAMTIELHAVAGDLSVLWIALMTFSALFLVVLLVADHLLKAETDIAAEPTVVDVPAGADLPQAA